MKFLFDILGCPSAKLIAGDEVIYDPNGECDLQKLVRDTPLGLVALGRNGAEISPGAEPPVEVCRTFKPKRETGPLRLWCQCGVHKDNHA